MNEQSEIGGRMLETLRERVRRSGMSQREIERQIGLGHGTLSHILRGRTELRIRHLERLGPILGFTLEEFLTEAFAPRATELSIETLEDMVARVVRAQLQAYRETHDPDDR